MPRKQPSKRKVPISREFLTEISGLIAELLKEAEASPAEIAREFAEELAGKYSWHGLYDAAFTYCLSAYIYCLSGHQNILEANAKDPYLSMLKWAFAGQPELAEWIKAHPNKKPLMAFAGVHIVMCKNLRSIALYSRSINAQLALAASTKDDKHFFDAVRIDPSVIQSRAMAKRIRKATIDDDKDFLGKLGNAIKGKTGRGASYLSVPRVVVIMLKETGQLQAMSQAERSELLISHLRLLTDTPDTEETFARFIRRQLKSPADKI